MNPKRAILIFAFIALTVLLVSSVSCGTAQETFRDETITSENKTEIVSKANSELTVEEARLLDQYLQRSYPDLAENDLPAGRTLNQMITEERVIESTRPAPSADEPTEAEVEQAVAPDPPSRPPAPAPNPPRAQTPPPPPPASEPVVQAPVSQSASTQPEVSKPEETPADTYSPSDQAVDSGEAAPAEMIPEAVAPEIPQPVIVEVESGTDIMVRLVESITTENAESGDRFELELAQDLEVGDQLVAPKGTRARGRVIESLGSGKVKGLATISLTLTDLYIEGEQFPLRAETLTYQAEKTTGKDAAKVGVASGIGALIGAIIGGGKGAAIGAGVGAGAGAGTVMATKGDELVFPVEQMFRFRLTEGFKVEILE